MSYCENCGNKLSDTAKFCKSCGEKINNISPTTEIQSKETIPQWSLETFLEDNPPDEKGIITCPRCMGKGNVDIDDIKRLSMEHNWSPGECIYCDGIGLVNIKITETSSVDDEIHFSDAQMKTLENLSKVAESRQGAYCFYDDYHFDEYFGNLPKDYNLYLADRIPKSKLNAFFSKYQFNSKDKIHFDDSSEYSPYVYFEDQMSDDGANSFLIEVLDKSDDWFDNGNIRLIINNGYTSLGIHFSLIDKIEQIDTKLMIEYYYQGKTENFQFSFPNCAYVLSALRHFFYDFKDRDNNEDEDELDEDDSIMPLDFERYFGHLTQRFKVYLGENIPNKKTNAFANNFLKRMPDIASFDYNTFYVYYDDTLMGKGDTGFLIASFDNDIQNSKLFVLSSDGTAVFASLSIITSITHRKSTFMMDFINPGDKNPTSVTCEFGGCDLVLEALMNFYNFYFKNDFEKEKNIVIPTSPIKPKDSAGIR
jgi:hypothetical protein